MRFAVAMLLWVGVGCHAGWVQAKPVAATTADKTATVSAVPAMSPADAPVRPEQDSVPIESLRVFASVYERVRQNFVEPVSDDQLFDNAMGGLLSRLDPYSEFLDPQSYTRLLAFTEGDIAHTALQVKANVDTWQISEVAAQSPAMQAGIQVGDSLLRIDGKSTRTLSQQDIEQMLRGTIGSSVRLTVGRQGQRNRELSIRRIAPEAHAVRYTIRSDGIVILSMRAFQAHTGQQILDVLEPLEQRGALRGLILDVRDNPGGLLSSAVEVADYFLAGGVIVSTQGRGEPEQRYQAVSQQRFANVPMMVLINRYSASAAEVLAGALQDHGRATIVGQTSYGKGSVQKLWPIEGGRAVKLTVSRYFTPKGRMIEGLGIVPDVLLPEVIAANQRGLLSGNPEQDDDLEQTIALMLQRLAPAASPSVSNSLVPSPAMQQP
ncbi:MAG: S41 family peptidase [Moraxellaceae bacterium]